MLIKSSARLSLAAVLLAVLPKTFGQVVTPPERPPGEEEAPLELSPFVINAEEDEGYQAKSTLAGTRVRTELKDVGSAISVVTSKFLQDTGARNNQDLLKYTTNTEVGGIGGTFSGAGNGRTPGEPNLLRPNSNTRVRGLTAADNTRDFFLTEIPWDSYNIGRVDIQRGPSSILFGMGSPAGIINNSTNAASFKNSNKVEVRFDNEGSLRGSVDFNHVLLKDELALRFAALDDHTKYRQKPAFNKDERTYGAIKFDPSFLKKNGMSTSLRANYEHGDIHGNRPRSITPYDNITPWFTQLNRQTYDPFDSWVTTDRRRSLLTGGVRNPNFEPWLGGYGNVGNNATAIFDSPSTTQQSLMRNWETGVAYWGIGPNNAISSAELLAEAKANNYFGIGSPGAWDRSIEGPGGDFATQQGISSYAGWADNVFNPTPSDPLNQGLPYKAIGAYKDKTITDTGIFDFYNKLLDGPNKWERQDFETFNIALSQTFFNGRAGLEGVYDNQKYHESRINGVQNNIFVDINSVMPSGSPLSIAGSPNNFVGRAFVQSDNYGSMYSSESEAKRLTGFAEFRASDFLDKGLLRYIIGRHVFTGMYAEEERDTVSLGFQRYLMGQDYAYALRGTNGDANKITNLGVPIVTYLSGDLRGVSDPSAIHLNNPQVFVTPSTLTLNGVKGVYAFDSHWAKPVDPSDPNYVNPAAFFNNTRNTALNTQSENVENYRAWTQVPTSDVLDFEKGGQGMYHQGQKTWRNVKSQAFVWQGYLADGVVVPTIGWRRDEFRGAGIEAKKNARDQINPDDPAFQVSHDQLLVAGESTSYSVVVHTPRSIVEKMPLRTSLSVFYNRSDNFQPRPGDVDMFNQPLANPTGKTKDYGFVISTLDDRVNLKVNWYKTSVENDRLQGFNFGAISSTVATMMASAYRVRVKDPDNPWKWDYSSWVNNGGQARADEAAQLVLQTYNSNPVFKNFVEGWGLTSSLNSENSSGNPPPGISATADSESKGVEFELAAEPVKGWSIAFNASKTEATQKNIGGALKSWIEVMDPIMNGPIGDLRQWWAGDSNNFRIVWAAQVMSQFNRLKAQEETNVPELRPWRYNVVTNYNFNSQLFGGRLNGINVGGAYRWEDKVVIGNPVITRTNAATGLPELIYDVHNPYYGPSESHLDAWIGYGRKNIFRGIDWRIQLNVRDLFAEKKLIPVSVQPDGSPGAYRIPALTSWSVTNTFTF